MQKAHTIWLATNRNCLVFDKDSRQILEYQRAMTCYRMHKKLALQATNEASNFYIMLRLSEQFWEVTRREMQCLLGLRTKKMDMEEIKGG